MKASDKDKVLNFLKSNEMVSVSKIPGDSKSNAIACYSLKEDGYILIFEKETSDDFNIRLTDKGKYYKEWGGYSLTAKQEKDKKMVELAWRALCYLLGAITGGIGQYIVFQLTHPK